MATVAVVVVAVVVAGAWQQGVIAIIGHVARLTKMRVKEREITSITTPHTNAPLLHVCFIHWHSSGRRTTTTIL